MNIKDFDLNLLLALDALLKERHVTRAATRVGLSQPAMSNALARLRDLLEDPLLVRTPKGMVPTPRAERLQQPVREALGSIERAIGDAETFDPERTQATFSIMTSDAIASLLMPGMIQRVRDRAPGIDLRVHPILDDEPWQPLEQGSMDLLIGVYGEARAGFHSQVLYPEQFVCLVRSDHPMVKDRLTLRIYVELPHLMVTTTRTGLGTSAVDKALAGRGLTRRIAATVPSFLVAPQVVAESDCVLTFPRRLAERFCTGLPVRILAPPLSLPRYEIRQYWHRRLHAETSGQWLREQMLQAAAMLNDGAQEPSGALRLAEQAG